MAQAITSPDVLEMLVGEQLDLSVDFTNLIAAGDIVAIIYKGAVLIDNPTGYWRCGDTLGTLTAIDSISGNPHNGVITASGVTLGVAGALNNDSTSAILFDGSTGSITISSAAFNPSGVNPFSIEAWVKPTVVDTNYRRIGGREAVINHGTQIYWQSAAGWGFLRGDSGGNSDVATGGTPSAGTWAHVVGTYDGVTMRLYVNGSLISTTASSRSVDVGSSSLLIGGTNASGNGQTTIQEFAVYNTALSQTRIAAHYLAGTASILSLPLSITNASTNEVVNTAIIGTPFVSSNAIINVTVNSTPLRKKTNYIANFSCTASGGGTSKKVGALLIIRIIY